MTCINIPHSNIQNDEEEEEEKKKSNVTPSTPSHALHSLPFSLAQPLCRHHRSEFDCSRRHPGISISFFRKKDVSSRKLLLWLCLCNRQQTANTLDEIYCVCVCGRLKNVGRIRHWRYIFFSLFMTIFRWSENFDEKKQMLQWHCAIVLLLRDNWHWSECANASQNWRTITCGGCGIRRMFFQLIDNVTETHKTTAKDQNKRKFIVSIFQMTRITRDGTASMPISINNHLKKCRCAIDDDSQCGDTDRSREMHIIHCTTAHAQLMQFASVRQSVGCFALAKIIRPKKKHAILCGVAFAAYEIASKQSEKKKKEQKTTNKLIFARVVFFVIIVCQLRVAHARMSGEENGQMKITKSTSGRCRQSMCRCTCDDHCTIANGTKRNAFSPLSSVLVRNSTNCGGNVCMPISEYTETKPALCAAV